MLLTTAVQAHGAVTGTGSLGSASGAQDCPMVKIEAERLPDLNMPRHSNLALFCQNGELTIFGGHTTGFVMTPTAEYYSNGKWHQMPMTYNHDYGLCVRLSSGKLLLGGGATQNLGIGQSFETEVYDPFTHTFSQYGCLDRKRFHSTGIELDSGRVVIAGNWYTKDGIELYDTLTNTFSFVKEVAQPRSHSYIFRTAKDNVMILSGIGDRGEAITAPIIDRLKGEPFTVPLFETWFPLYAHNDINSEDSFIGDASEGDYAYLMPVMNNDGQVAIAQVRDTVFTLLPTACPIPMESTWGPIRWAGSILVDRKAHRGYLIGDNADCRQFILAIDYAAEPAKLTVYYTDPMPDAGCYQPVISPEGNLYIVGGTNAKHSNFNPLPSVLCYHLGRPASEASNQGSVHLILWIVLALALLAAISLILFFRLKHKKAHSIESAVTGTGSLGFASGASPHDCLMQQITQLMEEKRPYLNSDLKMLDIASQLGVRQSELSACISTFKKCSFSQFVNSYRVAYAQQLMREQSDIKMSQVGQESGFANDTTFYRVFKTITGLTPSEWLATMK